MANAFTPLALVNQAFRNLGELPIVSFTDATNPRSLLASQFYITVRDDLLTDHFWNFATKRVVLLPYSEPSATLTPGAVTGTAVTFTASASGVFGLNAVGKRLVGDGVPGDATITALVATTPAATLTPAAGALIPGQTGVLFVASAAVFSGLGTEVGRLIENLGGAGVARVTANSSTNQVTATIVTAWDSLTPMGSTGWRLVRTDMVTADITQDFASVAALAAGDWRLWNAPPTWGFTYEMDLPTDYLRMQRADESRLYQREGDVILTDEPSLPITYSSQVTDVTRYAPAFVSCFVAKLTAEFAGQITDLTPKRDLWLRLAEARLRRAKKDDGQEGSAPQVTASDLIQARRGGFPGWPKRRFP